MKTKGEKLFNKIYSYSLLDRDATKAKIISSIDEIGSLIKKNDVFIFFMPVMAVRRRALFILLHRR